MTKTVQEIQDFVAGTTVNVLEMPDGDYPYYYLGEEYLAWAEYIDFSAFNPFEELGFEIAYYTVKASKEFYGNESYYVGATRLDNEVAVDKGFSQTLKDLEALNPHVTVTKSE